MLAGLSTNWLTLAVSSLSSLGDDHRLTAAQGHGRSLSPTSLEVHGGPVERLGVDAPLSDFDNGAKGSNRLRRMRTSVQQLRSTHARNNFETVTRSHGAALCRSPTLYTQP